MFQESKRTYTNNFHGKKIFQERKRNQMIGNIQITIVLQELILINIALKLQVLSLTQHYTLVKLSGVLISQASSLIQHVHLPVEFLLSFFTNLFSSNPKNIWMLIMIAPRIQMIQRKTSVVISRAHQERNIWMTMRMQLELMLEYL